MTDEQYEFVRTAGTGERDEMTLWERGLEPVWLRPVDVQQLGLGDKLREGVAAERERVERAESAGEDVRWASESAPGASAPAPAAEGPSDRLTLVGGHTDGWRWSYVTDGDDVYCCVDNRPGVEEAAAEGRTPPTLQQAVLPYDVMLLVCGMGEATDSGPRDDDARAAV